MHHVPLLGDRTLTPFFNNGEEPEKSQRKGQRTESMYGRA